MKDRLMVSKDLQETAAREERAITIFTEFVGNNADLLRAVAHLGDGRCGALLQIMQDKLLSPETASSSEKYKKATIPASLRKKIFERDAYRCVKCEGWQDLTLDHIHPESLGGPTEESNLQTMCRSCNSKKGARV